MHMFACMHSKVCMYACIRVAMWQHNLKIKQSLYKMHLKKYNYSLTSLLLCFFYFPDSIAFVIAFFCECTNFVILYPTGQYNLYSTRTRQQRLAFELSAKRENNLSSSCHNNSVSDISIKFNCCS